MAGTLAMTKKKDKQSRERRGLRERIIIVSGSALRKLEVQAFPCLTRFKQSRRAFINWLSRAVDTSVGSYCRRSPQKCPGRDKKFIVPARGFNSP
jgi:hypothetical protein